MNTTYVKQKIHNFIDHADERFLRLVYSMIVSEKAEKHYFSTTDDEMIARTKRSIKSVDEGKTRNISLLKKDLGSWKKNRAI